MQKIEYASLEQILSDAGVKSIHWKGWTGNSQLILSQEYAAKVFIQNAFSELLKDIEVGNLQSLDKVAWRLREILGDSQSNENNAIKPEGQ